MDFHILILCGGVGYLVGAISFTRIVVRLAAPGTDLSKASIKVSGVSEPMPMTSVSANTVGIVLGPRLGGLIAILDVLKVFLPTLLVRLLLPAQPYYLVTALGAMIGHIWPVYYRFKGGRGVSAVYGSLLAIDWLGAIVTSLAGMFISMTLLRDFALIFPLSLLLIIPWMWFTSHDLLYVLYAVAVNLIFAVALIPEIKQVIQSRKEKGDAGSMQEMMETNPMGQSMLSIARKLNLVK